MNTVADTSDKLEVDVNVIFKEEIDIIKSFQYYKCSEILQRIWIKGLKNEYCKDAASFETIAQFVLQHTESMLFGFFWNTISTNETQQIKEYVTQWQQSLTNESLRDKCQHILDHIYSPHNHPTLNKLKRVKLTDDWRNEAIRYLMNERGSTIVLRLKVYSTFPDYATIIQYAKNCWNIISSLSFDHPLSKAISVDEFYSVLAYHMTSMYCTGDLNYILQLMIDMDITETLKLIEKFPIIKGEMEQNSQVLLEILYQYHFNEFLRSNDSDASVDEHLMILTNSYCQRYKHKPSKEFGELILNIASTGLACPTRKLFIILHVIHNECSGSHLNFKLKLAFLGLTYDFNQLEQKKADLEYDTTDILAAEAELSEFFVFVSDVLISFPELHRECILTAFTLNPNEQIYVKMKQIAKNQGLDSINCMPKGSIPAITDTGYLITVNYNPFEAPSYIIDTNEIDLEVREDLSRAITHPRLKFISWAMQFREFCDICEKLMAGQKEDFTKNVVASANENLENVDIDFSRFKDWPDKEGDDGIEKGYHIFLDDDDDSEEDDDKTLTSPEAAALIKEAEIKLKKKKMVMKRKSTLVKKLMKNGLPSKKILMKCPPRKIPRPPNCNRIDWKHIEELKEYFKEHSHLITATQLFNDAQTLVNKLKELSANEEEPNAPEQITHNTPIGSMSGDINLNIIPIDPNDGVVVKTSSEIEDENFPNTSLVLPNSIDHGTNNELTSKISAVNLPIPSTSMTSEKSCDEVAEITKQLLQRLDEVDAELRLHYRRQKNYLANIKRRNIKSGNIDPPVKVEPSETKESAPVDSTESLLTSVANALIMSNLKTEDNSNMANGSTLPNDLDISNEENMNISENKFLGFGQQPEQNEDFMAATENKIAEDPAIFVKMEPSELQPIYHPTDDEISELAPPVDPDTSTINELELLKPDLIEQIRKHYDEIIEMVASSSFDESTYTLIEKTKKTKTPKIKKLKEKKIGEKKIGEKKIGEKKIGKKKITAPATTTEATAGTSDFNLQSKADVELNGTDPNPIEKVLKVKKPRKNKKKLVEGEPLPANEQPINSQSEAVGGQNEPVKKKPRKPRSKNKPKITQNSDQSSTEKSGEVSQQICSGTSDPNLPNSSNPPNVDMSIEKKIKPRRPRKPRVRQPMEPREGYYTPNSKLIDIPDDVITIRGTAYMESIERAIQKVMAGVITPEEMTMTEIDGVLDNILNMNNGDLEVDPDHNEAANVNHISNDSTILEQDYTENFDLALTNDDLYQDENNASVASVEDDKNKVTILSDLLVDEPQYFPTNPAIDESNGNLSSTNPMNTSQSNDIYTNEFNGFAELISPKLVSNDSHVGTVEIPSESYTSCTLTDISYNTKTQNHLSNDAKYFECLKFKTEMETNNCGSSVPFENVTEINNPEDQSVPTFIGEIIEEQLTSLNEVKMEPTLNIDDDHSRNITNVDEIKTESTTVFEDISQQTLNVCEQTTNVDEQIANFGQPTMNANAISQHTISNDEIISLPTTDVVAATTLYTRNMDEIIETEPTNQMIETISQQLIDVCETVKQQTTNVCETVEQQTTNVCETVEQQTTNVCETVEQQTTNACEIKAERTTDDGVVQQTTNVCQIKAEEITDSGVAQQTTNVCEIKADRIIDGAVAQQTPDICGVITERPPDTGQIYSPATLPLTLNTPKIFNDHLAPVQEVKTGPTLLEPTVLNFQSITKSNGFPEIPKPIFRSTSSLRFVRKPNHRQLISTLPKIKTRKVTVRLDRSIVDDYISSQASKFSNLINKSSMQPIVLLKRIELAKLDENPVKRSQSSRIGKRKQNRPIWDGENVLLKNTFKRRRRDDSDDAEGSSGFTGGSGSCYSSDSQSGTTSNSRETDETPPPKSTNGGTKDCNEDSCQRLSKFSLNRKELTGFTFDMGELSRCGSFLTKDINDLGFLKTRSGKLNTQKFDNLCNSNGELSSVTISSPNCNLISSVSSNTNKLSYFKPIQTSAKFANVGTVLSHLMTLNKLPSILKSNPKTHLQSNLIMPNLLKSVPGVETFEHFLAPAHHRYQTVEIVQLAKQLLPASGDCNENDSQRDTSVLSSESTSKIIPTIEANMSFSDGESEMSNTTSSRISTPITKTSTVSTAVAQQQIITQTTITPHIQKIGQPTSCNTLTFNRSLESSVSVPTSRNSNSVAVVFVKSPDVLHQSTDTLANNKRSESTIIKVNSEQQQQHQKVVQLCAQLSQNQQNSSQLTKILNKPMNQSSSQQHLLQILNAPPSRNLNNNLFTATATNGNLVSGGSGGNIMTFASNNGGSTQLPNNLYICKTDGKTIQLTPLTNNRLMTTSAPNLKTTLNGFYINNNLKKTVNQVADEAKSATTTVSLETKHNPTTVVKSQINTRSMYEENYAKFIQTATHKTQPSTNEIQIKTEGNQVSASTSSAQSNSLPKFNHAFGKTIISSESVVASQTKTTTSTITLTVSDDDNDSSSTSVCQDAATQTSATISKAKHAKKNLQTITKDVKLINENPLSNEKPKQPATTSHVIYTRQMPVLTTAQHFNQSTILQGINRMIQSTGNNNVTTTAKKDIKIIHQPMSSNLPTGMRISMPIVSSSMQQIQTTKLIRPVIQLPQTILRSTGQAENRQQFLITTPGDPTSNIRYENLIVTATSQGQSSQSSNRNVDNSTLEQLREFDMVLEQVKERSTTTLITTPNPLSSIAVKQSVNQLLTSGENQIIQATNSTPDIIYTTSNGQSVIQKVNVAYVQQHQLHNTPLVVVTNYCQPQASSSSNTQQNPNAVSPSISPLKSPNKARNSIPQIAATLSNLKSCPKVATKPISTVGVTAMIPTPKYTSTITAVTNSISLSTPITTTTSVNNTTISISSTSSVSSSSSKPPPKLQEDEQTVQRIYNILAEYAEQLRNSPDLNNKPAPRRRCNIPSNTSANASSSSTTSSNTSSTSKKRKSSLSSSSKRSAAENDLDRTMESEDSSGVSLHDHNDDASQHSLSNTTEKSPPVLVTSVPNSNIGLSSSVLTPIAARSTTVSRQLILADSVMSLCSSTATSTSSSATTVTNSRQVLISDSSTGLCGKIGNETALLMPRNYVLPMSVIKSGGQQYAIVASATQASKLLESGQLKHVNNELWQQQRSTGAAPSTIVLQGFLNKNLQRTNSLQPEQMAKQPLKIHKSNSQTFANIEGANALCQTQGNGGAIFLQTIPTTMMSSPPSTILTNLVKSEPSTIMSSPPPTILTSLVKSESQSHNMSAFARVPQQSRQSSIGLQSHEQQQQQQSHEQQHQSQSHGIILIENIKQEEDVEDEEVVAAGTIAKKRKFQDDDNSSESPLNQNELKWSSDQYLEQSSSIKCEMESISIPKVSNNSMSANTTKSNPPIISTSISDTSRITTISSCSDENLRFLISNPYQATVKTRNELRNRHLKNNFVLNTNGSIGNRILLQQLCHERKQAAIERELRLQKSLSEECEDLGVGEPSTSDLFPEADLLFDTCSPAFDGQDSATTPIDVSKQRIFFQTTQQMVSRTNHDCEDKSSSDDEKHFELIKTTNDSNIKVSVTPNFLRHKDDTMMSSDFDVISPYVQENSNSSGELKQSHKDVQDSDDGAGESVVKEEYSLVSPTTICDFDKLKSSMDWEGGPKKTYSKSSLRTNKKTPENPLTSIKKTVSSEIESASFSITSSAPTLHQRRITQYHNKKKIPPSFKLNTIKPSSIISNVSKKSPETMDAALIKCNETKNNLLSRQRKRRLSLSSNVSVEQGKTEQSVNTTSQCTAPYILNHSIGSMSGSVSSSFKIIKSTETASTAISLPPASSTTPKIINHQMRSNQASFDEDVFYGTVNGANSKISKQTRKR